MTGTTLTTSASFFKTAISIFGSALRWEWRYEGKATYRLECVSGRVDEEDTTVNTSIRDESVSHSSELFPQVRRVLIFDLRISHAELELWKQP